MGANTSIYTKNSIMPVMMHDFPFGEQLTSQNQLDLSLETVLWGLCGFLIETMTHVSLFASLSIPNPDKTLEGVGIYEVDPAFYTIASFVQVFAAFMKLFLTAVAFQFYITRISLYGKDCTNSLLADCITLDPQARTHVLDYMWVILFSYGVLIQFYRMVYYIISIQTWLPYK